jgi:hypothetical protein
MERGARVSMGGDFCVTQVGKGAPIYNKSLFGGRFKWEPEDLGRRKPTHRLAAASIAEIQALTVVATTR